MTAEILIGGRSAQTAGIFAAYASFAGAAVGVVGAVSAPPVVLAVILIVVSAINLVWASRQPAVFLMYLILLYFNYSIAAGEYFGYEGVGVPDSFDKPEDVYYRMLVVVTLFNIGLGFFPFCMGATAMRVVGSCAREEPAFAWLCLVSALAILIFGIDRTPSDEYAVKITAAYEYSSLIVLVGLAFSKEATLVRWALTLMTFLLVLEDLRQGGRITSIRLLIGLYLMQSRIAVSNRNIAIAFVFGVLLMQFVGVSRSGTVVDFFGAISSIAERAFVFDTVVYAYYASITHLMLEQVTDFGFLLRSLESLIAYLAFLDFGGGGEFNLTEQAHSRGFINIGGGVAASYLYFWGGLPAAFLGGLGFAIVFRYFFLAKSRFGWIYFVALVAALPRWYLYGVWIFPRTIIVLSLGLAGLALIRRMLLRGSRRLEFGRVGAG